jgi:hypothetical protein
MPTTMIVDLRAPAPHYTLTRPADTVVSIDHGYTRANGVPLDRMPAERAKVLGDLAKARQSVLSDLQRTSGMARSVVTGDLAGERGRVLSDLDAEREAVFAGIRGDSAGPQTVLRTVPVNLQQRDAIRQQANLTRDPQLKTKLLALAGAEEVFAYAMAAAQQVVQDAIMAGAEWIYGDARYMAAVALRGLMVDAAVRDYNVQIPVDFYAEWKLPFATMGV